MGSLISGGGQTQGASRRTARPLRTWQTTGQSPLLRWTASRISYTQRSSQKWWKEALRGVHIPILSHQVVEGNFLAAPPACVREMGDFKPIPQHKRETTSLLRGAEARGAPAAVTSPKAPVALAEAARLAPPSASQLPQAVNQLVERWEKARLPAEKRVIEAKANEEMDGGTLSTSPLRKPKGEGSRKPTEEEDVEVVLHHKPAQQSRAFPPPPNPFQEPPAPPTALRRGRERARVSVRRPHARGDSAAGQEWGSQNVALANSMEVELLGALEQPPVPQSSSGDSKAAAETSAIGKVQLCPFRREGPFSSRSDPGHPPLSTTISAQQLEPSSHALPAHVPSAGTSRAHKVSVGELSKKVYGAPTLPQEYEDSEEEPIAEETSDFPGDLDKHEGVEGHPREVTWPSLRAHVGARPYGLVLLTWLRVAIWGQCGTRVSGPSCKGGNMGAWWQKPGNLKEALRASVKEDACAPGGLELISGKLRILSVKTRVGRTRPWVGVERIIGCVVAMSLLPMGAGLYQKVPGSWRSPGVSMGVRCTGSKLRRAHESFRVMLMSPGCCDALLRLYYETDEGV
ncbi:hypothetical protein Efla_000466 [Eimeria flavescens]